MTAFNSPNTEEIEAESPDEDSGLIVFPTVFVFCCLPLAFTAAILVLKLLSFEPGTTQILVIASIMLFCGLEEQK